MLSFRQLRAGLFVLVLCLGAGVLPASAQDLSLQAVDVSVSGSGETTQATFRIAVSNPGDAAATNVRVVFADGVESYVGDVEAGGKTSSQPETRTLDLVATPTQNVPLKVTVKYSSGDAPVEQAAILTVRLN